MVRSLSTLHWSTAGLGLYLQVTIKAIQKLSGARVNVVEYTQTQSAVNVVGEYSARVILLPVSDAVIL